MYKDHENRVFSRDIYMMVRQTIKCSRKQGTRRKQDKTYCLLPSCLNIDCGRQNSVQRNKGEKQLEMINKIDNWNLINKAPCVQYHSVKSRATDNVNSSMLHLIESMLATRFWSSCNAEMGTSNGVGGYI